MNRSRSRPPDISVSAESSCCERRATFNGVCIMYTHPLRYVRNISSLAVKLIKISKDRELYVPLHVAPFGSAETYNALFGKHVQGKWVDSLLVDNHKAPVIAIAYFLLQLDDFANTIIDEGSLSVHQLLSLRGALVEKS